MTTRDDGTVVLDHARFHDTQPQRLPPDTTVALAS